jgi:hypothetical protein
MATSQNQGFIEQLREMRATRTQQLRQGNQEAALLNKQITALTNLDRTMRAVLKTQNISSNSLRDINTKQNNMIRQTDQMSKSINNLSTSITRSIGNLASSAVRGTGSAVGSAGGAVVGAASSVSSAIVSGLLKTLPFAIAGVIGKMFVYDKMDESTKKELGESFSGLMSSIFGGLDDTEFGKVVKPITKELGIVFGALGDTISSLFGRIEDVFGKFSKIPTTFEEAGKNLEKSIERITGSLDKFAIKAEALGRTLNIFSGVPDISGSDVGTAVSVVGTGAAAVGAKKIYDKAKANSSSPVAATSSAVSASSATASNPSSMKTASVAKNMSKEEVELMKKAFEEIRSLGLKKDIFGILGGRLIAHAKMAAGVFAEFLKLAYKFKLTSGLTLVSLGLQYFEYNFIANEIDILLENGYIDSKENAEYLKSYIRSESFARAGSSIVGGVLGLAAGLGAGPASVVVSPALGVAGAYAFGEAGADVARASYELLYPMPESLKKTFDGGEVNVNKLYDNNKSTKPQGAINPSPASSSSSNVGFERFKGAIGRAETESEPDPYRARNRAGSSASGKYQVIKDTFERYSKIKGSPVYGMTFEEFQNSSPEIQEALMDYMLQDYNRILTAGKVPINEKTLYLAHFLGPETAVKVYNADPNDDLSKYITKPGLYDKMIKQNPGLVKHGTTTGGIQLELGKRVSSRMAAKGNSTASISSTSQANITETVPSAQPAINTSTPFPSYADNYDRRSKESEANQNTTSNYFGGDKKSALVDSEKSKPSALSAFASQFSIESFTSDFAARTKELTDVVDSMFAAQTQQAPTIMADNSSVTNVTNNSSGGGGGPSINQVISNHMSNMNWQFNTLSGGARA